VDVSRIRTRIGGQTSIIIQIDEDYYVGGRAGKREEAAGPQWHG
jgi:hypothetical protein